MSPRALKSTRKAFSTAGQDHSVAVVAFDGISPFHLSVPCMVFGNDFSAVDQPRFKLVVCADQPGTL
ncbi:MAG: GlxA family transcriptional regulator, partial [Polaromonas sp.]|nr:GlxA family transcriptional regulator [Polaromonas sp.]